MCFQHLKFNFMVGQLRPLAKLWAAQVKTLSMQPKQFDFSQGPLFHAALPALPSFPLCLCTVNAVIHFNKEKTMSPKTVEFKKGCGMVFVLCIGPLNGLLCFVLACCKCGKPKRA